MNSKSTGREPRPLFVVSALLLLSLAAPLAQAEVGDPLLGAVLLDLQRSQDRLIALAEAIPEDQFGWRPSEGVRSVGEVLLHVAGANHLFADGLGLPLPEGVTYKTAEGGRGFVFDMENEVTGKSRITAALRESLARLRQAVTALDGTDLGQVGVLADSVRLPRRDVCVLLMGHGNSHLGQLIAYARTIGVVPPWSATAAR